jgi:preprotein translocase subunit SecG
MIIIEVLSGGLLVGVILLQRTKSQGLGGMAFGASIGESVFGSRAGNVLTKATVILGCLFLANTLFLAISYTHATAAAGGRPRSVMETRGVMPQPSRVMPTPAPTAVPTAPAVTPAPAPAAAPVAAPAAAPAAK